jgi:8-oxo-dGTP diphosphatase
LPPDEYVASLARKRMAAGALFRDSVGRVLLVEPTYKPTWEIPGGAVEEEESPPAACCREVLEELGLARRAGRVLAVDWVPSRPERPEGLVLVYDGGELAGTDIAAISLQAGELSSFAFVERERVPEMASALLARRIAACIEAAAAGTTVSLENGYLAG